MNQLSALKPKTIVFETFKEFRMRRWIDANGGGLSIRNDSHIYYLPSSITSSLPKRQDVQKKTMSTDETMDVCAGKFDLPPGMQNVTAVVHTHSINAIRFAETTSNGVHTWVKSHHTQGINRRVQGGNTDEIQLPVIDDHFSDDELLKSMENAFKDRQHSYSVLVKGHGLFTFDVKSLRSCSRCLRFKG
ncbi:uncharacterized protein LOC129577369 isoform X3 [Sitodiplosis mosellana]|uniref:uncharacterized protein LOC129577369 isoform X3 n=1 Tax=Sitodiplosis mosellana TaxID=263140 RepID=UPI00244412B3|nr:uncharacterized protein LOC129577369 isoform X3 [Sitodiplosis mosellana]